jgi:D-glycero-D-manno-heptose 1,7-bisphosphate phosphatase
MSKIKALFLDRDGTIIENKHYLKDISKIHFFQDTIAALKIFHRKGYTFFLVTNQSGLAHGYFNTEDLFRIHSYLNLELMINGLPSFEQIQFCPHQDSDHCLCRKPKNQMLQNLIKSYPIDLNSSLMIGDMKIDLEMGQSLNIPSYLIRNLEFKDQTYFRPDLMTLAQEAQ